MSSEEEYLYMGDFVKPVLALFHAWKGIIGYDDEKGFLSNITYNPATRTDSDIYILSVFKEKFKLLTFIGTFTAEVETKDSELIDIIQKMDFPDDILPLTACIFPRPSSLRKADNPLYTKLFEVIEGL